MAWCSGAATLADWIRAPARVDQSEQRQVIGGVRSLRRLRIYSSEEDLLFRLWLAVSCWSLLILGRYAKVLDERRARSGTRYQLGHRGLGRVCSLFFRREHPLPPLPHLHRYAACLPTRRHCSKCSTSRISRQSFVSVFPQHDRRMLKQPKQMSPCTVFVRRS